MDMKKQDLQKRIELIAMKDPIVASLYSQHLTAGMPLEECLMLMVIEMFKRHGAMVDTAMSLLDKTQPPWVLKDSQESL